MDGAEAVVRFNGGANAGHTVVLPDGVRHVHRHFGSGTLRGIPTYLSEFFVCNPILFFNELKELQTLGLKPVVFAHPDCLVTTFIDMIINQEKETRRGAKRHGSCGVGLWETVIRSKIPELKITYADLMFNRHTLEAKLLRICGKWSQYRIGRKIQEPEAIEHFLKCCEAFQWYVEPGGIGRFNDVIMEGAQGLLLDQDNKQMQPHVTGSSTGMTNPEILFQRGDFNEVEAYYVSRTYLTRHGAGLLPGEDSQLSYVDDTNIDGPWQGRLRFAPLDDALKLRIAADAAGVPHELVLTHCDQLTPPTIADLYSSGSTHLDVSQAAETIMV
jgi:adenylosuccinate synthase